MQQVWVKGNNIKILIIDSEAGQGVDFAMRCKAAGHDVKLWINPYADGARRTAGDGLVPRVTNWREHVKWADMIFPTGNAYGMAERDKLIEQGYPIFGASSAGCKLELDRVFAMTQLERHGVEMIPYSLHDNLDSAQAFIKKNGGMWVIKPADGGEPDKSLTFVPSHEDYAEEEINGVLEKWKKNGKRGMKVMLQEFSPGIEVGVSCYFGPGGWGKWKNTCFEHKKLASHNFGPNCGEAGTIVHYTEASKIFDKFMVPMTEYLHAVNHVGDIAVNCIVTKKGDIGFLEWTCYDDQTEVLTEDGWKVFDDVIEGEAIYTLNPDTNTAEYMPAVDIIKKPYKGEMLHFMGDNYGADLCVTPDHAVWAKRANQTIFEWTTAEKIAAGGMMWQVQRSADWEGAEQEFFTLPEYVETHHLGWHKTTCEIVHESKQILMDDWLRFLGMYISEGSMNTKNGKSYIASISQKKHKKLFGEMLKKLPFHVGEHSFGWQIASIQLCDWVQKNIPGICNEKRIPREFLSLSARQLDILFEYLVLGDGSVHRGQRIYYTTSSGLADDVHELITKLGHLGRISMRSAKGTFMTVAGKTYERNHDTYVVHEKKVKKTSWLDRKRMERIDYNGMVYCLNVPPHHLLYVRRNGNALWCGNCRAGWPHWNLVQETHLGDPANWMLDCIDGSDTLKVSTDVCCGLVVTIPNFPFTTDRNKAAEGIPILGLNDKNLKHIHFCEARKSPNGGFETAGEYVAVVSGKGKTVVEATKPAYDITEYIGLPNKQCRDDIGEKLEKQLPELHKHGIATEIEYR